MVRVHALYLSAFFFDEVLRHIGEHIRALHPALEAQIGRLDQASIGWRRPGAIEDVVLDCQFGINSPLDRPSRVRSVHCDHHHKLFNALLYMRTDDDDSTGGDLVLYQLRGARIWGHKGDPYGIPDDHVTQVAQIPYRANTLVLFVNSPISLHGVSERQPTKHVHRYLNFLAHTRVPLFEAPAYLIP
ncbi:MAG: 2OG-Fe(II) oxygenase [Gammaproteobacteria bacterium]